VPLQLALLARRGAEGALPLVILLAWRGGGPALPQRLLLAQRSAGAARPASPWRGQRGCSSGRVVIDSSGQRQERGSSSGQAGAHVNWPRPAQRALGAQSSPQTGRLTRWQPPTGYVRCGSRGQGLHTPTTSQALLTHSESKHERH